MPRPRGPKPIRPKPLSQRVAKPQNSIVNTTQSTAKPRKQSDELVKISTKVIERDDGLHGSQAGKENESSTKPARKAGTKQAQVKKPLKNTKRSRTSISTRAAGTIERAYGDQDQKIVGQRSSTTNSPGLMSGSAAERRPINRIAPSVASSRRTSQAHKSQSTPLAHSSLLGALHFKKRARQPSLLQVAQSQQEAPSDVDDDEDFLDLPPDDESTPLVKSSFSHPRALVQSSGNAQKSRKRKLGDSGTDVLDSEQRQKPPPSSSSPPSSPNQILSRENLFDLPPDDDEDDLPPPVLPRFHARKTPSPTSMTDSQAPPRSSSSALQSPSAPKRQKANSKDVTEDEQTFPSTSPVTTKARHITKRSNTMVLSPPKAPTTARLQNLLPRRRTRLKPASTYDIPSSSDVELDASGLAEDEDELSFHATAKMKKRKTVAKRTTKIRVTATRAQKAHGEPQRKRVSMTYSKKVGSDDYSGDEEEEATLDTADTSLEIDAETGKIMPVLETKAKEEMKKLAEKFKEIDDFDMEFEDVTGSSSQMHDAR